MPTGTTPEDRTQDDHLDDVAHGVPATPDLAAAARRVREAPAYPLPAMASLRATAEAALSSVDLAASDEIVPRWKDRLGGADVVTLGNAWAMAETLRLDLDSMGPFGIAPRGLSCSHVRRACCPLPQTGPHQP